MTLRVLVIDDDETVRRLIAQHIGVAFEDPAIAEFDPARQGRLPAEFGASGYDAVVLDDAPAGEEGLVWLRDLAARPGFPPVIYLMGDASPAAQSTAREAGAHVCLPKRKIDHARLVAALRNAETARRGAAPASTPRAGPRAESRFGEFTIPGYRCVRVLARNPASSVFLAASERSGGQVVLKLIGHLSEDDARQTVFDRFLREYAIASAIRHPNIVRIHDFGVADDHAFIVMEYFPAGDLRGRIRQGIGVRQALAYLRQMAGALEVLHGAGVLHRDLKPGNVMLREDGSVVLIDFGLAKLHEPDGRITAGGEIFGTPYYMSPEQGHGRATDARGDVYSLGVMFFEMLTRRKPYVAATPMQVIYKQANSPLPELDGDLARFQPLLAQCIAKQPEARFPSAAALERAVIEIEREESARGGGA
ncbi:MAG: protein kinase [Steroidobacteraceae bacterium]